MSLPPGEGVGTRPRSYLVDVDLASVAVFTVTAALAAGVWAIVTIAPDMVTGIAVGRRARPGCSTASASRG